MTTRYLNNVNLRLLQSRIIKFLIIQLSQKYFSYRVFYSLFSFPLVPLQLFSKPQVKPPIQTPYGPSPQFTASLHLHLYFSQVLFTASPLKPPPFNTSHVFTALVFHGPEEHSVVTFKFPKVNSNRNYFDEKNISKFFSSSLFSQISESPCRALPCLLRVNRHHLRLHPYFRCYIIILPLLLIKFLTLLLLVIVFFLLILLMTIILFLIQ